MPHITFKLKSPNHRLSFSCSHGDMWGYEPFTNAEIFSLAVLTAGLALSV